jgi:1-acyl-sn-glycerol-3-phosphate acyltransferase
MTGGTGREAHRAPTGNGPTAPGNPPATPTDATGSSTDLTGPTGPTGPAAAPGELGGSSTDPSGGDRGPGGASGDGGEAAEGGEGSRTGPDGVAGRAAAPQAADVVGGGSGNPDRGYLIAAVVVKPLMRAWFRIRLVGEEHIPREGPVILASNHRSNMDPVLLASAVTRPVTFMAKAELFVGPLAWILRWIGQFPVRRGGIDREALRRTDAVLARGSMLGLFPEGTRGDGRFSAVHAGLAYIVVRQGCPVLPVAIFGTERVRRRLGWLPFASPVRIVVGPPIDLPRSISGRAGRRAASEVLQQRLQAFLATATGPGRPPMPIDSQSDE